MYICMYVYIYIDIDIMSSMCTGEICYTECTYMYIYIGMVCVCVIHIHIIHTHTRTAMHDTPLYVKKTNGKETDLIQAAM
jgi:hypothetical protein